MSTNLQLCHGLYEEAFMELNIKEFHKEYMSYLINALQIQNQLILNIHLNLLINFTV